MGETKGPKAPDRHLDGRRDRQTDRQTDTPKTIQHPHLRAVNKASIFPVNWINLSYDPAKISL